MDDVFKYEKRYWYPHLKPLDTAIWERFLEKYPEAYTHVMYDLAVGEGAPIAPGEEENLAHMQKTLTQRKIDVVGFAPGKLDIIELKPAAGPSALGQVNSYVALYKRDRDPTSDPQAVIITDRLLPDMQMLANEAGVKLIVV